jgi:hypothetical protein
VEKLFLCTQNGNAFIDPDMDQGLVPGAIGRKQREDFYLSSILPSSAIDRW